MIILRQKIFVDLSKFAQMGKGVVKKVVKSRRREKRKLDQVRRAAQEMTRKAEKRIRKIKDPNVREKAIQTVNQNRASMYNTAQRAANNEVQAVERKVTSNYNKSQNKQLQKVKNIGADARQEVAEIMGTPSPSYQRSSYSRTPNRRVEPAYTPPSNTGSDTSKKKKKGVLGKIALGTAGVGTLGAGGLYLKNRLNQTKNSAEVEENAAAISE